MSSHTDISTESPWDFKALEFMDYMSNLQMRQSEQTFQMRELGEQRVNLPQANFTYHVTDTTKIDAALDEEDIPKMEALLVTALSDPQLPVLRRAKYEILLAICPGQDPVLHVPNAERMFVRIQQHIDQGNASDYSIGLLKSLKETRDNIMDNLEDV